MSEATDDVRRALTIVFRGTDGLARPDVERAFSFDMEWVGPHEAEQVVDALLAAGWLEAQGQHLCLAVEIGAVDVPFGWFPRPARLLNPAQASGSEEGVEHVRTAASTASERAASSPGAGRPPQPAIADDPRARLTRRVASFISRQSGLDAEELQRRAERKINAFQLITPWMAYALVAREQGLVMDDIVKALDVN